MSKATALADKLTTGIVTGSDWPNTEDEVLRLNAAAELRRLDAVVNEPQADDFLRAVSTEAEHQRQRFSSDHDAGKTRADWMWLLAHLHTRALEHHKNGVRLTERIDLCGDPNGFIAQELAFHREKAEHHLITSAAGLANWHAAITGKYTAMRPGIDGDAALSSSGGNES